VRTNLFSLIIKNLQSLIAITELLFYSSLRGLYLKVAVVKQTGSLPLRFFL
jgi:hypothetical protein